MHQDLKAEMVGGRYTASFSFQIEKFRDVSFSYIYKTSWDI